MVKKGLKIEKEKEIIYNVFKITKEEVKYMMKENKKGITLLALVITIVIMLLLAGVALQMALYQGQHKRNHYKKKQNYMIQQNLNM